LLKIIENKKELKIHLDDFKKLNSIDNQYNNYFDLKRTVVKPILNDLKNIGYDVEFNETRNTRSIEYIEFLIK
jgi:plasmid replication initiation protein